MSLNVANWHHRGGMSNIGGSANLAYTIDPETGEQIPLVWGVDEFGNPTIVNANNQAPWYGTLLQAGIQTAGNIFGRNYNNYNLPFGGPAAGGPLVGGATVAASASPGGIGAGLNLSTNTMLLIGVVAAFFILGKGRR